MLVGEDVLAREKREALLWRNLRTAVQKENYLAVANLLCKGLQESSQLDLLRILNGTLTAIIHNEQEQQYLKQKKQQQQKLASGFSKFASTQFPQGMNVMSLTERCAKCWKRMMRVMFNKEAAIAFLSDVLNAYQSDNFKSICKEMNDSAEYEYMEEEEQMEAINDICFKVVSCPLQERFGFAADKEGYKELHNVIRYIAQSDKEVRDMEEKMQEEILRNFPKFGYLSRLRSKEIKIQSFNSARRASGAEHYWGIQQNVSSNLEESSSNEYNAFQMYNRSSQVQSWVPPDGSNEGGVERFAVQGNPFQATPPRSSVRRELAHSSSNGKMEGSDGGNSPFAADKASAGGRDQNSPEHNRFTYNRVPPQGFGVKESAFATDGAIAGPPQGFGVKESAFATDGAIAGNHKQKSQFQHNKTPQLRSQVLPSGNIASGAKTSSMQKDPFAADNASLEWFTKIQQQNS